MRCADWRHVTRTRKIAHGDALRIIIELLCKIINDATGDGTIVGRIVDIFARLGVLAESGRLDLARPNYAWNRWGIVFIARFLQQDGLTHSGVRGLVRRTVLDGGRSRTQGVLGDAHALLFIESSLEAILERGIFQAQDVLVFFRQRKSPHGIFERHRFNLGLVDGAIGGRHRICDGVPIRAIALDLHLPDHGRPGIVPEMLNMVVVIGNVRHTGKSDAKGGFVRLAGVSLSLLVSMAR